MSAPEQNPFTCGDGGCVLRIPGAKTGMHTNAGCRCLMNPMTPDKRVRVRQGIRWMAEKVAALHDQRSM